jgi:hypothetical protein
MLPLEVPIAMENIGTSLANSHRVFFFRPISQHSRPPPNGSRLIQPTVGANAWPVLVPPNIPCDGKPLIRFPLWPREPRVVFYEIPHFRPLGTRLSKTSQANTKALKPDSAPKLSWGISAAALASPQRPCARFLDLVTNMLSQVTP